MLEKPRNFILGKRRSYSEIGAVFGIVPRLLNWAIWPTHNANGATHIGLPQVSVQLGPVTWAQGFISWRQSLGLDQ